MAVKKRRLTDLFVVGKNVTINDESGGNAVDVYIRKLNPVEYELALRRANAKRSRMIREGRNESSELWEDTYSNALDQGVEACIEILLAEDASQIRASVEAEIAARDEWSEKDYLQGLSDAWGDGLNVEYAKDPEHEEAKKVYDELVKYRDAVEEEVEARLSILREGWQNRDDDDIFDAVVPKLLQLESDAEWMKEFRTCQVWLSVKDPENTKVNYFTNRAEVDDLSTEVFVQLVSEYQALEVEPTEGKSLEETPASSNS